MSRTNFDNFLYAYLLIKINAPELNLPSGAKLNVLTAVTWPSALSTEDYSGVLMKMESSVKFNFEQVTTN